MSEPITSVTEGRVTITANDTEDNIRQSAGFAGTKETDEVAESDATAEKPKLPPDSSASAERNPDGTFKSKAEADDAAAKPAEKAEKPSGNPRTSFQAKIDLLTAQKREAERRAEESDRKAAERDAELQSYRTRQTPQATPAPTPPSQPAISKYLADVQRYQAEPDAPKFEEFAAAGLEDPYTVHQAAMAAYIADRRLSERDAQQSQAAEQREYQSRLATSFELAAQKHADFADLISTDQRAYPPAVAEHLKAEAAHDPELSAELFHHLLTHPDDAERLATMTHPIAAAREIGRLTAGLLSAPSGPETAPLTTMAKPLIKPVRTSVMAPESSPPEDLPFGPKYIAAMNERDRKAREARRA